MQKSLDFGTESISGISYLNRTQMKFIHLWQLT